MKRAIAVAVIIAAAIAISVLLIPKAGGRADREAVKEAEDTIGIRAERHKIIDSYFEKRNMPLAGYGKEMVMASDKYGIDWRLLPAIAVRESSGGKQSCGNNPFGWGSCNKGVGEFESIEQGIDTVAKALGTGRLYAGKTVYQKLQTYNPPTIVAAYADEVIKIMDAIGPEDIQLK